MTWIAFFFALEAGIVTHNGWMVHNSYMDTEYPTAYTEFDAEVVALEVFFLRARLRTDIAHLWGVGWDPRVTAYDNTFGVRIGPVEIGLQHFCLHPMETYLGQFGDRGGRIIEGGFEEVYIRFEYGRKPKRLEEING